MRQGHAHEKIGNGIWHRSGTKILLKGAWHLKGFGGGGVELKYPKASLSVPAGAASFDLSSLKSGMDDSTDQNGS